MKLIKGLLFLLNILAVLALISVKLGSIVSPNTIVLAAYASLALLPIVIVNVLFVLFWAMVRKWSFMLLSLLALILLSNTAKSALPINFKESEVDTTYQKVTVLSYNTMSTGLMKKHTKESPNQIIQYILDTDADIVCLQELAFSQNDHQFQENDFERIFREYPYKHVSFQMNRWNMNIGVCTLSKYPIIEKRNIDYHSDFNLSTYTDIVIGGDTVRVVNNHLESNRITAKDMEKTADLRNDFSSEKLGAITKYLSQKLGIAYKKRALQADVVSKLIENSPYKVISCGDYNDVPMSYTYTKIKGNLNDAFKEVGNGLGWTYVHSFYRFRIDYIMYDKSFHVANYKMGNLKESDHYPIQVDLYLFKRD